MSETIPPIGTLTDRIQFKRREIPGAGAEPMFVPVTNLWARVRSCASVDDQNAPTHTVVLRYRTDVRDGDRIVYRGRYLEVLSAADLNGRRAYLRVETREVPNV